MCVIELYRAISDMGDKGNPRESFGFAFVRLWLCNFSCSRYDFWSLTTLIYRYVRELKSSSIQSTKMRVHVDINVPPCMPPEMDSGLGERAMLLAMCNRVFSTIITKPNLELCLVDFHQDTCNHVTIINPINFSGNKNNYVAHLINQSDPRHLYRFLCISVITIIDINGDNPGGSLALDNFHRIVCSR